VESHGVSPGKFVQHFGPRATQVIRPSLAYRDRTKHGTVVRREPGGRILIRLRTNGPKSGPIMRHEYSHSGVPVGPALQISLSLPIAITTGASEYR
jgi:hypothetical protein